MLDPLLLELQVVESAQCGCQELNSGLLEEQKCSRHLSHLSSSAACFRVSKCRTSYINQKKTLDQQPWNSRHKPVTGEKLRAGRGGAHTFNARTGGKLGRSL